MRVTGTDRLRARGPGWGAAVSALGLFVCCVAPVACGHAAIPEAKTVSLRLRGAPANATVTIDDILVGPLDVVQARGVGLPPGAHRISVEASGYLPWDKTIDAAHADGRPVQIEVVLVKIPD